MKDKFNFNIDNAFAAAVIAQNINKRYIKVTQEPPGVSANRTLVMSMLTDVIPFTDSEMEAGRKIRQYFQQHLTFKIVKGVEISPFEMAFSIASMAFGTFSLKSNTSFPASKAFTSTLPGSKNLATPFMFNASVKTSPLYPSSLRNKSVTTLGDKVEARFFAVSNTGIFK